jgi:uncharacterized protein (DUF58 family)
VSADAGSLVDPAFLARLERLTFRSKGLFAGLALGERRSVLRGTGLEFAGHRGYVPGDDLRALDWAALGRLSKAFVKTFEEERDLTVHLLLDTSRSMAFGSPSKLRAASRVAAALAHVALASLDRVGAALFDGRGLRLHAPARGRGALFPLLAFLESAAADGPGDPEKALRLHAAAARPGLTVLLSDFLETRAVESLLPHRARRHALVLVQVLAPEELDPPLEGDLKLVDSETGEELEVSVGPRERAAYLARVEEHREGLRRFGKKHGLDVFSISSALPVEEVVFGHLLKGSLLS